MAITSRQNPLVAQYRAAARGDAGDLMLLDGAHLVADAIAAGLTIRHAAATPEARADGAVGRLLAALARAGIDVSDVSASVMDAISPVRSPSVIVALAERPTGEPDAMYASGEALIVIAVDVQDPGNIGAIARVAEAAGATGLVTAGASADPFSWKALRGSMGSALRLPIAAGQSAEQAIADARGKGCRIVATVPRDGTEVSASNLTGPLAVLIGGEGQGLSTALLADADERVTISMKLPVESLNTAVTAALILYEARRQRTHEVT